MLLTADVILMSLIYQKDSIELTILDEIKADTCSSPYVENEIISAFKTNDPYFKYIDSYWIVFLFK